MFQRMYLRRRFDHDGRSLELRAALSSPNWHLGVFEHGAPVSAEITRLSQRDVELARRRQGVDLIEDTLQLLQRQIEGGELRLRPAFLRG